MNLYSLYSNLINNGIVNISLNNALANVTEMIIPTVTLGGLMENNMIRKPKKRITEVKQIALPVSTKVMRIDSSMLIPFFLDN